MPTNPTPRPPQINYRHVQPSPAVTEKIQAEVTKLSRYHDEIISCSVAVETPDRHHQHGRHFRIAIELVLPGGVIIVDHQPSARRALLQAESAKAKKQNGVDATHRDVYITIRDAFDVVRRRLEDAVRRRRDRQ